MASTADAASDRSNGPAKALSSQSDRLAQGLAAVFVILWLMAALGLTGRVRNFVTVLTSLEVGRFSADVV